MGLDGEQDRLIEQLYQEMYMPLCAYAMGTLNDLGLAEEAVQDTFRIACAKADKLCESENQRGWLTNTLKNVMRNMQRSRARLNNLVITALSIDDMEIATACDIDFDVTYSDLIGRDDFILLKKIVLDNFTMLELAAELNISVAACKKRVQRAKKKLQKLLKENY